MKKIYLTLLVALATVVHAGAQTFEWGTATWNIEDGTVFDGTEDLAQKGGIVLTYSNPANYTLTFLNVIAVDYNLFVDDAEEPIAAEASAQAGTAVAFDYEFVEGHKYKIVTTGAHLAQVNLATFSTDTVSVNSDVYTISFTIKGPELVKTIEVEGTMALTIINQEEQLTYSLIDVESVKEALGISDLSEAKVYGLNINGSYNEHFRDYYDGWRDADGEYTIWSGGYDAYHGRNAYPAVYSIKLNETADMVSYYFYDYWKLYDPNDPGSTGGTTVTTARELAPETSYHSIIWDWQEDDGTITQYTRFYRTDEGKDYKASFAIVANKKYVLINATLHFVSQADYEAGQSAKSYEGFIASGIAMPDNPGMPLLQSSEAQTVTISPAENEGEVNITFSGFTLPMMGAPTGEQTITAKATVAEDGSVNYSASDIIIGISRGAMVMNYMAELSGVQVADESPVIVLKLSQASIITSVFNSTLELAVAALAEQYAIATGIEAAQMERNMAPGTEIYNLNGILQNGLQKGFNLIKGADGNIRKVLVK